MPGELGADHGQVRIEGLALAVEGVGGAVEADEALAGVDRLQQLRLALVGDHVARGVESDQVELVQVAVEDALFLAADHLEAGLLAHFGQHLLRMGQLAILAADHGMLESGAAGEVEHFLRLLLGGGRPTQREGGQTEDRGPRRP